MAGAVGPSAGFAGQSRRRQWPLQLAWHPADVLAASNPLEPNAQVETGSAITCKYPSVVLVGKGSVGEFYSVALTNNHQQADTGSKMIHVGANTRSRIISKGISAGQSRNCYRGLVQARPATLKTLKVCLQTLRTVLYSSAVLPAAQVRAVHVRLLQAPLHCLWQWASLTACSAGAKAFWEE